MTGTIVLCDVCWGRMFASQPSGSHFRQQTEVEQGCAICAPVMPPRTATPACVVRKHTCVECGYRHVEGVDVTVEWPLGSNGEPVHRPGAHGGWFACDECGCLQTVATRVTRSDLA